MIFAWLKGLALHRPAQLFGTALGTALSVALVATLYGFVTSSAASMTQRAAQSVAVDWQLQTNAGSSPTAAMQAMRDAAPIVAIERVAYARVTGLSATTGGTVQ